MRISHRAAENCDGRVSGRCRRDVRRQPAGVGDTMVLGQRRPVSAGRRQSEPSQHGNIGAARSVNDRRASDRVLQGVRRVPGTPGDDHLGSVRRRLIANAGDALCEEAKIAKRRHNDRKPRLQTHVAIVF